MLGQEVLSSIPIFDKSGSVVSLSSKRSSWIESSISDNSGTEAGAMLIMNGLKPFRLEDVSIERTQVRYCDSGCGE